MPCSFKMEGNKSILFSDVNCVSSSFVALLGANIRFGVNRAIDSLSIRKEWEIKCKGGIL